MTLIGCKLAGSSVDRYGLGIAESKLRNNSAVLLSYNTQSLRRVISIAAKKSFENNYTNTGNYKPQIPEAARVFIVTSVLRISEIVIGYVKSEISTAVSCL
jgi:hypothetical protein